MNKNPLFPPLFKGGFQKQSYSKNQEYFNLFSIVDYRFSNETGMEPCLYNNKTWIPYQARNNNVRQVTIKN